MTCTQVGYAGGTLPRPTYSDVCSHGTGHAEVVEVEYAPAAISYEQLLDVFWSSHNPAVRSGRWFDPTSQYRSVIFFHTPEQEHAAKGSAAQLEASGKLRGKLATQVLSAPTFWRAEEYHQQFYEKQGRVSCAIRRL